MANAAAKVREMALIGMGKFSNLVVRGIMGRETGAFKGNFRAPPNMTILVM